MTDALVRSIAKETARKYYADKHPGDAGVKRVDFLAENNWDFWKEGSVRALQAIEAAGYRVVPVEATEGMVSAGCGAIEDIDQENVDENDTRFWGQPWRPCAIGAWSAMLSAAPRVGEG